MKRVRRMLELIRAALREIFDESAYGRFLAREGLASSREAYGRFLEEQACRRTRPRCC